METIAGNGLPWFILIFPSRAGLEQRVLAASPACLLPGHSRLLSSVFLVQHLVSHTVLM